MSYQAKSYGTSLIGLGTKRHRGQTGAIHLESQGSEQSRKIAGEHSRHRKSDPCGTRTRKSKAQSHFLLDALNRAFSAVWNNLSGASLVNNSESTHAQPKLDAIHGAEQVRAIVRLGGPTGIIAMHVGSQSWRIERIQLTFAAANWLL